MPLMHSDLCSCRSVHGPVLCHPWLLVCGPICQGQSQADTQPCPTHRHHSEDCVDHTSSNGGIDRLCDASSFKNPCRIIEHLEREEKVGHSHDSTFESMSLILCLTACMPRGEFLSSTPCYETACFQSRGIHLVQGWSVSPGCMWRK